MTAGRWGRIALGLCSVTAFGAHGAASMLVPMLMPICTAGASGSPISGSGVLLPALLAVGAHGAAMLLVTGVVAAGASVAPGALRRPLQNFFVRRCRIWAQDCAVTLRIR